MKTKQNIKEKHKAEFKKHYSNFKIEKNVVVDDGEGVVSFPKGLTITDNKEQRNGTKYDIKSMDLSEYKGNVTADHAMSIQGIIGKAFGIKKVANKRVTIDGIKFALKENALAKFTYDMLKAGLVTDFSIETYGPWPDEDGVYKDSKLVGLSAVVLGNNKSAAVNKLITNSFRHAKNNNVDTTALNKLLSSYNIKSSNTMKKTKSKSKETKTTKKAKNESVNFEEALNKALTPLMSKVDDLEQKVFDNSAKEPEFSSKKSTKSTSISSDLNGMHWRDVHAKQINYAWDYLKNSDNSAKKKLKDINKFNLEKLQENEIVPNSLTISDFGNFIISKELLSEIEGTRSNFTPLISRLNFRETLSTQMAWLTRSGDIDMEEVEMCDDGEDGNLKPVSEYSATINTSNLHELAAVTPVCNAATRFLAADLLGDVAEGYRTDYDRKRAQLFIAKLQEAVDSTGNEFTYSTDTDLNSVKSWIDVVSAITEEVENGVFILNTKSKWQLIKRAIGSGISGDILGIVKSGDLTPILGAPSIVVPNELLPTLNTAETKSFTVEGSAVSVTNAVFYVDLSTFTGRTSGGLQYDLSTDAAYEVDDSVRSAFQRNELVLRGSFFRGGAIKDENKVSALSAPGVS